MARQGRVMPPPGCAALAAGGMCRRQPGQGRAGQGWYGAFGLVRDFALSRLARRKIGRGNIGRNCASNTKSYNRAHLPHQVFTPMLVVWPKLNS